MYLLEFCTAGDRSVGRERLVYHKAVYDLKLFAATYGHEAQVTEPEIDNLGHDFTLSIGRDTLNIQNKAAIRPGGATSWDIHAAHLVPPFQDRDIGPDVDGVPLFWPEGASGVVLLHEIDRDAASAGVLNLRYFYFDVYYAAAVAHGIVEAEDLSPQAALDLLRKLRDCKSASDRVTVPKAAFLPVKSPAAIIGLRLGVPQATNYVSLWRRGDGFEAWTVEPFRTTVRNEIMSWRP
ncbi:hypothetical protein [Caulobacter segnis]